MPNGDFVAALRDEKLLAVAAGDNVVRLLPPLIVGDAEIGEAMKRLDRPPAPSCEAGLVAQARRGAAE